MALEFVRILFPLNILRTNLWNLARFAYALILTTSRLGLLHINFHKFITELRLLIMSEFCFRSIFWGQIDGI